MTQDRGDLCFSEEAQTALKFLERDHGFTCVAASELRVRYESNKVYIEMLHGIQDCEVHIKFGRLGMDEQFSFQLFLQSVNPALEKTLGDRMAHTSKKVATTVRRVAMALQSDGQEIINGDDKVFDRMKNVFWWHFDPEALE